jgi:hypothetical protein
MLLAVRKYSIVNSRPDQPVVRGQHVARDTVLCFPRRREMRKRPLTVTLVKVRQNAEAIFKTDGDIHYTTN